MIKSKGNNLGKVKDMDVINQAREKNKKGKPLNNNAKCEKELRQKKALQASCPSGCQQKKK